MSYQEKAEEFADAMFNFDGICAADCGVNVSSTITDSINALKCNVPSFNAKKLSSHIAGVVINVTL